MPSKKQKSAIQFWIGAVFVAIIPFLYQYAQTPQPWVFYLLLGGLWLCVTCGTFSYGYVDRSPAGFVGKCARIIVIFVIASAVTAIFASQLDWEKINGYYPITVVSYEKFLNPQSKQVWINMNFQYEGTNPVQLKGSYKVFIVERDEVFTEPTLIQAQDDCWRIWKGLDQTVASPIQVPPHEKSMVSLMGPIITDVQMEKMRQRKAALFFAGTFVYGEHEDQKEFCGFSINDPKLFFMCKKHNT